MRGSRSSSSADHGRHASRSSGVGRFAVIGAAVELVSRQLRTGRPDHPTALEPVITRLMLGALDRGRTG